MLDLVTAPRHDSHVEPNDVLPGDLLRPAHENVIVWAGTDSHDGSQVDVVHRHEVCLMLCWFTHYAMVVTSKQRIGYVLSSYVCLA